MSGDLQLSWEGRRVRAYRTSEFDWPPQGYGIEVHGGSSGGFLSLVTTTKPASGRYPIGRSALVDGVPPDVSHYDAMFYPSQSLDAYQSDSGWVDLRRKLGGTEGKFLIYLSERSAQPHRIVVSGSFR